MSSFISKLFNTPFLQNKFVLYVSLFIVLITVVRHLSNRNTNAVVLMALIGLVSSYFSKNMIIVLLTAFFTVFVLEVLGYQGVMEGMENTKKDGEGETERETDADADADAADADAGAADADADADAAENKSKETKTEKKEGNQTLHSKKEPMKKNKQGMAALSPASYDGKDHDDGENAHGAKEANRIDYASTLEQAYDNIENIIGEDGVRGLTDQTKSLMNQQKELMNNMKEMGPLLKSAEGFMEQLTGNGGIRGITEMLKGFATPGGKKK